MLASIGMSPDALVVLGCGHIARRHAAAARRLGIPIVFASRDVARARAYARTYGGIAAFGSYDEALADSRPVAAIVCTPHDRHLADTLSALRAGKHVLVEKPIARTLEEADAMIDAAQAADRVLMVAENFHFMPAFQYVRALIERGEVGALREIHLVARGFRRHRGWRLAVENAGGGALIDGGIHYVHNLRWWGGPVTRVFALRPPQTIAELGGEDSVSVLATLDGGVVGFVANSLGAPGLPKLQYSTVTGASATGFVDNRGRFVAVRGRGRLRFRLFRRDRRGHQGMLDAFREAMRSREPPACDGRSGRADLAVVLAAYRSIAEGRAVDL
jgi:predicted dehydrogenase